MPRARRQGERIKIKNYLRSVPASIRVHRYATNYLWARYTAHCTPHPADPSVEYCTRTVHIVVDRPLIFHLEQCPPSVQLLVLYEVVFGSYLHSVPRCPVAHWATYTATRLIFWIRYIHKCITYRTSTYRT